MFFRGEVIIYRKVFKRIIDIILSTLGIICLSPILLVISIFVYIFIVKPIFFVQDRVGKNGKIFKMVKFRSMTDETDKFGNLLDDSKRITKLGKFLRNTSLDELPELINVLKGDMSLVGPRPLLVDYIDLYSDEEFRRHEVSPGITGLAQVKGRNLLTWESRFKLDVEYVDNVNFKNDVWILKETIFITLKREGITDGKTVSMKKFTGSHCDIDIKN